MPRIPMPRPVPVFRSNVVTLRPPHPEADARDYFTMSLDPEMHTGGGGHAPTSVEEAQEELERIVSLPLLSTWMVVDNPSERVVGRFFLCLEDRDGHRVVGEGNRMARPYWRKNHCCEARGLLFPYIFDELGADWIETGVWEENDCAISAMEASGFRLEREELEWNGRSGDEMAMRHYVLTREAWLAMRSVAVRR